MAKNYEKPNFYKLERKLLFFFIANPMRSSENLVKKIRRILWDLKVARFLSNKSQCCPCLKNIPLPVCKGSNIGGIFPKRCDISCFCKIFPNEGQLITRLGIFHPLPCLWQFPFLHPSKKRSKRGHRPISQHIVVGEKHCAMILHFLHSFHTLCTALALPAATWRCSSAFWQNCAVTWSQYQG